MKEKKCFKCNLVKSLSEFYKHPQTADGHLGKCKECTKRDVKDEYLENTQNPEYVHKERLRGRNKYNKYKYGRTDRSKLKRQKFDELNVSRYAALRIDIPEEHELHHWDYNKKYSVFLLHRRLHKRVHTYMHLNESEGIYYQKDYALDTLDKHWSIIEQVCVDFDYDPISIVHYQLDEIPLKSNK